MAACLPERHVTVESLSDGDVLRFGRTVLRYVEIRPPRRAEPIRRVSLARLRRRHVPLGTAAPGSCCSLIL